MPTDDVGETAVDQVRPRIERLEPDEPGGVPLGGPANRRGQRSRDPTSRRGDRDHPDATIRPENPLALPDYPGPCLTVQEVEQVRSRDQVKRIFGKRQRGRVSLAQLPPWRQVGGPPEHFRAPVNPNYLAGVPLANGEFGRQGGGTGRHIEQEVAGAGVKQIEQGPE